MNDRASLLFVDDEERVVDLLRMMFRSKYDVYTATSGQQALEIISGNVIDVIVSDQRMPGMTGIELLSQVRKRSPSTMRILLTGYSDLSAIVGSVNDGEVFRFINKPWDQAEITNIIADAVLAAQSTAKVFHQPVEGLDSLPAPEDMPALLLLDDNLGDSKAMQTLLSEDYTVYCAANVATALELLEQKNIGVIVSDAIVGGKSVGDFLRILKQHHPEIVTVMLTKSADSDLVIRLINGAQIFRFATKPIRASVFQLAVSAAMKEHLRFRASPSLVERHKVAATSEPEDLALVNSVVQSLKKFRFRFAHLFAGRVK